VVGVIIQAVTGLDSKSYTRQQLAMCRTNGLRTQGYVFPGGLAAKLARFDGHALEALWLDVELPITEAAVNAALIQCDAYTGQRTGLYSGKWFFDQQGWSHHSYWASRPLWDSHYNGVAVTQQGFVPYGGWTSCVIKQYAGTSAIGSVHQIDLDVEG
jgi:hypothetical protein